MNKRAGTSILATLLVMGLFSLATYNKSKITEWASSRKTENTEQIKKETPEEQLKEEPVEEKVENEKPKETPEDVAVATIDGVSIRSYNSSQGRYLGSLQTGDEVKIEQKMNNDWYKIKYKNDYAYVSSAFMRVGEKPEPSVVLNSGTVYNTRNLPVKKTPSQKSDKLGTIKKGDVVEVVDTTSNDYYKIKYNDTYGYIKGNKIKLDNEEKAEKLSSLRNLNDFLFIGDSFTYRMEDTIKANSKSYVVAQSGSRPSYWLDKVGDMPDNDKVKAVSVLIGVNGVTNESNIDDTKQLINSLTVKYPNKNIFVQKVFPVGSNYTEREADVQNKSIDNFNKEIEAFCKDKENIVFIDAIEGFVDEKGYLKDTSDGLHIDEKYNKDFYKNIFDAINKQ